MSEATATIHRHGIRQPKHMDDLDNIAAKLLDQESTSGGFGGCREKPSMLAMSSDPRRNGRYFPRTDPSRCLKNSDGFISSPVTIRMMFVSERLRSPRSTPPM